MGKLFTVLGLMSGTSGDGVDASIISSDGIDQYEEILNRYYKYDQKIYENLHNLRGKILKFSNLIEKKNEINNLEKEITLFHAKIVNEISKLIDKKVDFIGFHGQTIYHNSLEKISKQIGDGNLLSQLTKKIVINNFRQNDIKNGGEGAPLAPVFHRLIVKQKKIDLPVCILNIGGIANLTFWDGVDLIGFDTGPGNILMDTFFQEKFQKNFDDNGNFASLGNPKIKYISKFLTDEFFIAKYPKSLDREYFIKYLNYLKKQNLTDHDLMATLLEFTVISVQRGILQLPKKPKLMLVTGGGYLNSYLLKKLKQRLKIKLINSKNFNFSTDFVESELIAYLSARSINNLPITFPKTTGVNKPLCGGTTFFPEN